MRHPKADCIVSGWRFTRGIFAAKRRVPRGPQKTPWVIYNAGMRNLVRTSPILPAVLALTLSVFSSGCKSSTPTPDASTTNQPAGSGAPAQTGSGAASQASSAAPTQVTLTAEPGKEIHARINETINAKTANVGDPFTGQLSSALTTRTGETVFAQGTEVSGTVVSAKGQGRFAGAGVLAIEVREVGGHPVKATEFVVSKKGKGKRTAALIGGGAGGGALIGGLAGGRKGALFGGLIGGGAGTAGAAFTGNKPLLINSHEIVTFELTQPVSNTVTQ